MRAEPRVPLGTVVSPQNTKVVGKKDPALPYVGLEHLAPDVPVITGFASSLSSISVNGIFRKGDVLFGKLRPNLRKSAAAQTDGYCSTDLLVLRANEGFDSAFVAHALRAEAVFARAVATAIGTKMPRTSWAALKDLAIFAPSNVGEQRRIAEILDTLDDAIRSTEQFIAKLENVKRGLLHGLLTCGIDDNGEIRDPDRHPEQFKDSPLGTLPRSWTVASLGSRLRGIDAGKSPSLPDRPATAAEWGVLKVSAVRPQGFVSSENKVITNPALIDRELEVLDGDLLITRANTYELVGLMCLVRQPQPQLLLCDKTLRLHIDETRAAPGFVFLAGQTTAVRRQIEVNATGSSGSMKNISQDTIRGLMMAFPGLGEQERIVAAAESADEAIRSERGVAEKLRLLKKGLSDDLLTGRVRVAPKEGS